MRLPRASFLPLFPGYEAPESLPGVYTRVYASHTHPGVYTRVYTTLPTMYTLGTPCLPACLPVCTASVLRCRHRSTVRRREPWAQARRNAWAEAPERLLSPKGVTDGRGARARTRVLPGENYQMIG